MSESLIDGSKEVGVEVNVWKTKYMLVYCHQNAGQNLDIQIVNRMFEHVSQFRCLGMTVRSQNFAWKGIEKRLNSANACYHSIQNFLCSYVLTKNLKIKIYETIILLLVLYGCETWSLVIREHRLKVFENRVLRRIYGPKRTEVAGGCRKLHSKGLHDVYSLPSIINIIISIMQNQIID
jgi:hypothetical protein